MELSSPRVKGLRPSKASEASTLICRAKSAGLMALMAVESCAVSRVSGNSAVIASIMDAFNVFMVYSGQKLADLS